MKKFLRNLVILIIACVLPTAGCGKIQGAKALYLTHLTGSHEMRIYCNTTFVATNNDGFSKEVSFSDFSTYYLIITRDSVSIRYPDKDDNTPVPWLIDGTTLIIVVDIIAQDQDPWTGNMYADMNCIVPIQVHNVGLHDQEALIAEFTYDDDILTDLCGTYYVTWNILGLVN